MGCVESRAGRLFPSLSELKKKKKATSGGWDEIKKEKKWKEALYSRVERSGENLLNGLLSAHLLCFSLGHSSIQTFLDSMKKAELSHKGKVVMGCWTISLGRHLQFDTSSFRAEKTKAPKEPRSKEITWAAQLGSGKPGRECSLTFFWAATHFIPEHLTEVLPERTHSHLLLLWKPWVTAPTLNIQHRRDFRS